VSDSLRATAAQLRLKAHMSQLAVATARDLAVRLPSDLAAVIDQELSDGGLLKRWQQALAKAAAHLGDSHGEEEVQLAALSALLAEHGALASRLAFRFSNEVDALRQTSLGRAQGIEETLEALAKKEPAPEAES
jgi:hypothetical protein